MCELCGHQCWGKCDREAEMVDQSCEAPTIILCQNDGCHGPMDETGYYNGEIHCLRCRILQMQREWSDS